MKWVAVYIACSMAGWIAGELLSRAIFRRRDRKEQQPWRPDPNINYTGRWRNDPDPPAFHPEFGPVLYATSAGRLDFTKLTTATKELLDEVDRAREVYLGR